MPSQLFVNNAKSTLAVAVSSTSQASLTVQSGKGALFPDPKMPNYFMVSLDDGTNVEVCKCIARSGDVLTVLRGFEGTVAQSSFATGTKCELRLTADGLDWVGLNKRTSWVRPVISTQSWHVLGTTIPTAVGTVQAATMMNSSWRESNMRNIVRTSNSASTPADLRVAAPTVSGQNGFDYYARFGFAAVPNSSHFFVGLMNTTGAVASIHPPSSIQNGIVIGFVGSGLNANLSLWRANSAGPAVQLDLGSYFTVQTPAWYELGLTQQANNARIDYWVRRLDISSIPDVRSYFTTSIPDNSLWLSPYMHATTLVASNINVEFGGFTWES
jgi:hypothetical protein